MNPSAILISSIVVAAVTGGGVAFALRPAEAAPVTVSPEVQAALSRLDEQTKALRAAIDAVGAATASPTPATAERTSLPAVSDDQVAAAVERYLRQRGDGTPVDAATAAASAPRDVQAIYAELRGADFWQNSKLWRRAFEEGRMDEVIALFEEAVKNAPNDPDAHMQLASAYLSYLQMDQSKYPLSQKADAEFDKVLALDDKHWNARFSKAVSYTFWPDFLGKKPEAMKHFETLIQQQESMPPESQHAQTYLFLGNLLEQRGKSDEARAIWQKGARRHPDSDELKQKVGN
ncbi:MAG: hypothetical protein IPK26_26850 [Planctomycetes bacterium]|nr:hypothetical protein [Planctomycetota bacterium]